MDRWREGGRERKAHRRARKADGVNSSLKASKVENQTKQNKTKIDALD